MRVHSYALCSRLFKESWRPSISKAVLRRHGYAIRLSSNSRRHTILDDVDQGPACTCWSLLSPSSSLITLSIPSLRLRKAKIKSGKTPLVVLLVTPAHIPLLDDGDTFIPSLIQLAVEKSWSWQGFDLLAAVVDRIPQTSSATTYRSRHSHSADVVPPPEIRLEDGFEGISVAILDSEVAAPTLWSLNEMPNERERMKIQQQCTLSFSFPPSPGIRTQFSENSASQPLVERVLQMPLSNTLFQNGRTSTLFAQRWELKFCKGSAPEYMSSQKTWLPQQTVNMSALFANEGMRFQLDHLVRSCLVPLTPSRTVTAAMGNIVRKVSGNNALAETAPASEELERAISHAIQQSQISAQQVGIWALVRPQRYAALDKATPGAIRDVVEYAVLTGARLYKVLSGGGGWGAKHGLLALDPDSDFGHQHRAFEPSFSDDRDAEAETRKGFGEVAKPGDSITFYVCRSPSDADSTKIQTRVYLNRSQSITATLDFGSLPSNVDTMREVGTFGAEVHTRSELTVQENHFGMLSERGMSLKSSFLNTNITANRIQYFKPELDKQVYEVRQSNTVTTKLDAPYTLLSLRGQSSRIPVSSEVRGEELEAFNVDLQKLIPPEPSMVTDKTEPAATLVQRLPVTSDPRQEPQALTDYAFKQARGVLAKSEERLDEEYGKLECKEPRLTKLEASRVQLGAVKERNERVAAAVKILLEQYPGMSEKVAWKRARKAVASKRSDSLTSAVRFISQRQEPDHKTVFKPGFQEAQEAHEAQETRDALSGIVRRYISFGLSDQKYRMPQKEKLDMDIELDMGVKEGRGENKGRGEDELEFKESSRYSPDNVEGENELDSVQILQEVSEGKDPGIAHQGAGGNVFMLRKHFTRNPYERLQEIQRVGELASRDQAIVGLHGEYHLALGKPLGEVRKP